MIPGMLITKLVAPLMKKLLPMILDKVIRRFEGIEKMPRVVKYMEEDNEADIAVKQLADEIDNLKDVISVLKDEVKTLKQRKK